MHQVSRRKIDKNALIEIKTSEVECVHAWVLPDIVKDLHGRAQGVSEAVILVLRCSKGAGHLTTF